MFEIEKNVPIPTYNDKYPFAKMSIGESTLFPIEMAHKARAAVSSYVRISNNSAKFVTRKVDGGIRVWRIA